MPPIKCYQPTRLEAMASSRVSRLALDSCIQIQHRQQAGEVRRYFSAARPLLDDVLNHCLATARTRPLGIRAKVLLHVLVHPTMKTLNYTFIKWYAGMSKSIPGFKYNYLFDWFVDDSNDFEYVGRHLRIEPTLWGKYLPQLSNLTDLNLLGVDKRSIERVTQLVARSCSKLETITANWTTDALMHLGIIHSLRVIRGRESFYVVPFKNVFGFQTPAERLAKERVFRHLISNLPRLENISCQFIGQILAGLKDEQAEPLALVECFEVEPTLAKIEAIVDMCPNLTGLYLGSKNLLKGIEDLSPLTRSNLNISKLKIKSWGFIGGLEECIRMKGVFIKHLNLFVIESRTLERIPILIGMHCPMIETLRLCIKLVDGDNHPSNVMTAQDQDSMYQNLIEFKFTILSCADDWGMILPCLYNAGNLKSLKLQGKYEGVLFARAMSQLLDANSMSKLEELKIVWENIESVELVTRVANLPKLTDLRFHNCKFLTPGIEDYVNELKTWNTSKNLNLKVTVTEDSTI